jgi:hypothetical protein
VKSARHSLRLWNRLAATKAKEKVIEAGKRRKRR